MAAEKTCSLDVRWALHRATFSAVSQMAFVFQPRCRPHVPWTFFPASHRRLKLLWPTTTRTQDTKGQVEPTILVLHLSNVNERVCGVRCAKGMHVVVVVRGWLDGGRFVQVFVKGGQVFVLGVNDLCRQFASPRLAPLLPAFQPHRPQHHLQPKPALLLPKKNQMKKRTSATTRPPPCPLGSRRMRSGDLASAMCSCLPHHAEAPCLKFLFCWCSCPSV